MKHPRHHSITVPAIAGLASLAGWAGAQTFNWGSPFLGTIVDSTGTPLDSSYTFALGTFADSFVPTADNLAEWAANWLTLDIAEYNAEMGYFTGTFDLNAAGGSTSPDADAGVFFMQPVYLWVYGGYTGGTDETSEWFLAHSDNWVLPDGPEEGGGCCGDTPVQWTTNDLQNDEPPVVGGHNSTTGGGTVASPGFHDLQTYSVPIPEPATPLLAIAFSCLLFLQRMRMNR